MDIIGMAEYVVPGIVPPVPLGPIVLKNCPPRRSIREVSTSSASLESHTEPSFARFRKWGPCERKDTLTALSETR